MASRRLATLILVTSLLGGFILLNSLTTPNWGGWFPPHDIERTLEVSPAYSFSQSFAAEQGIVDGIALSIEEPSPDTKTKIEVSSGNTIHEVPVNFSDLHWSGDLFIRLPQPLRVGKGNKFNFTIIHVAGPPANLRFQINDRPYPDGELTRINQTSGMVDEHSGNLAFRIRYHSTMAEQTGLTTGKFFALSIAILSAWLLFLRYQPSTQFFPELHWQTRDWYTAILVSIIVAAVFFVPLYSARDRLPSQHDFSKETLYLNSALTAYQHGQLPVWHHATCGGQPLLGNPETNILSVGTVTGALAGPVAGLKLAIVLEVALLAAGGYVLGRAFGLKPVGAVIPALVLPLCGYIANRVYLGHLNLIGAIAYLPWVAAAFTLSLRKKPWIVVGAIFLTLMLLRGDTHAIAYSLLLIGFWAVWISIAKRTAKPLIALFIVTTFFIAFSAPKLLPTLASNDHFNSATLPKLFAPLTSLGLLDEVFLDDAEIRDPVNLTNGEDEDWENVGLHIGALVVALAIIGLLAAPPHLALLLVTTIFVFLVLGEGTVYEQVISPIPLFGDVLRIPSRLFMLVVVGVSLAGGFFIDILNRRRAVLATSFTLFLLFFVFTDVSSHATEILMRTQYINPAASAAPVTNAEIRPYNQKLATTHSISQVQAGALVPGLCLDFNKSPEFVSSKPAALVVSEESRAIASTTTLNQIEFTPPPSKKAYLHIVPSNHMVIQNGYDVLPNGNRMLPIVAINQSQPVVISYANQSFWAGLVVSLGLLVALSICYSPSAKNYEIASHSSR